ncbi:hypothetical protein M9H77_36847 [Catharanthus roseus]|uniref:Uncharacterized protein n=1 Tax=Catharanthus roseus TaxID=4058 RepID=A0ACB9ZSY5_CATRO|nr:hypothetical protein M9H77_36847 [Catharanthus roseus]
MAQRFDRQGRLKKIGYEAFGILEEHDSSRKGSSKQSPAITRQGSKHCLYRYQPQKSLVYQVNPASYATDHEEVTMSSCEAMKMHDGLLVLDYSKNKKSMAMAY